MLKKALFVLFFIAIGFTTTAQKFRKFTSEKEAYIKELEDYLKAESDANKKDELGPFMLEVSTVWNSEGISPEEAKEVYEISNTFLKKG